ncbi:hypothetical protein J6590_014200 [Homalodisca vitripennis]|nr:hypothetical protein J6590_014200 [Homalodisca vitripennis]
MCLRQAQALAKLTQAEHFNNLTLDQQQVMAHQTQAQMEMGLQAGLMAPHPHTPTPHTNSNVLAMLHQLAQYQQLQQRGGSVPVPQTEPVDPLQQLMQQMGLPGHTRAATTPQNTPEDQRSIEQFMAAFRQRQANPQPPMPPPTMESVWGGGTTSPAFPAWSAPTGGQTASAPPPQSLWSDPLTKGIKTEKDILSPVSENTLISNLVANGVDVISDDDLSDGYLENISSESEGEFAEESDSELSVTYLDDIVEDPTFELL